MPADELERFSIMNITEYKKKDGTIVYRTSLYLGIDSITGKKIKTTISARTKKEIKNKALQAKFEFEKNGATRTAFTQFENYGELMSSWWEVYSPTIKPNSRISIKSQIENYLRPAFGDIKLDKLTPAIIQQQVNKWAKDYNQDNNGFKQYAQLHSYNKSILQYGVSLQAIKSNPAKDIIVPKVKKDNAKIKHFTDSELKQFFEYLDSLDQTRFKNLFCVTLYKFLLATGCRINEALALEWSDIDLDNAVVHITKTLNLRKVPNSPKSKSGIRDIDIDVQTVTMLKQYKRQQIKEAWKIGKNETVVFSSLVRKYSDYRTLGNRLKKHFIEANVPSIGFHGFRHTHASLLLNAGIPYKELQHRLGHATLSMTMDTYSHLSKDSAKKAVSIFETALNNVKSS